MAIHTVVVGGGIIGCSVGCELARRGCDVTLVADRALAQGATRASGGMLVPYVEAHEAGPMLELSARSLALFDEFIARVRRDARGAEPFEYSRNGSLQVALEEPPVAPLQEGARWLAARGVKAEWLEPATLRRAEPLVSAAALGALLIPEHGVVGAEDLTAALWEAATTYGARFVPGQVTRITRASTGLMTISASGRALDADIVVLAPGAWLRRMAIEGAPAIPVEPVRGQIVHLRWPGTPPSHILWGPRCYVIPWRDGRTLVGATLEHVGYEERNTVAGVHDLLDAVSELVPHAWSATFDAARVGLRPDTPDHLPVLGRPASMPGLVYAAGHYRNGVLLAPITAALIADLIVDGRQDDLLAHFSPDRFGGSHG